jgi:perosamine synthetase
MADFIPVNEPLLDGNEKRYLQECIDSGWISSEGPFVGQFEDGVASLVGRKHGIAVCNGTAALDVAVAALGIGPGDEVILPTFTIISCAAAIVRAGATPVVVDADADTWNMDCRQVEALITPRTKAIMPVHIYGLPVDLEPVIALCDKHGLALIEDAAEAIGLRYRGRMCGSFGDISTLSFYPNKHVTTGEGGMVLTDDDQLAERCRALRNLCFGTERRFEHAELGWNYRMSNMQAAVGVAQLERLDPHMQIKRDIGAFYNAAFADLDGAQTPVAATDYADNCFWVYGLVLDDGSALDRDAFASKLREQAIGTRPFFWPMHEQPVFRDRGLFADVHCPVAERLGRRGLYIPSGLALGQDQLQRVGDAVVSTLA